MFISKKNIYIIMFSYIALILIYATINFNGINYLFDYIKNFFYWSYGNQNNNFKIIDVTEKKYNKPFKNIPEEFIHFGNTLYYKAKKGNSVKDIAGKSVIYTHFYKAHKLKNAIVKYNGLKNDKITNDTLLYIPFSISSIIPDTKNIKKPNLIYTLGLYYTGSSAGDENFFNKISAFKEVGINTVVFDAKDVEGELNYLSRVPLAIEYNTHERRTIDNIDKTIQLLKKEGIYIIARIAVFSDHLLCKRNPQFGIKSKRTGGMWRSTKEIWCDPTNKYVQDYNIQLAVELAEKGMDEIQFDYIRFPTAGDLSDTAFVYHNGKMSKEAVITQFLKRAFEEISKRNTRLSIDIFGVVAWEKEIDIEKTGQRIGALSAYCDYLSPMLYPSHFDYDFDGLRKPADEPYYFIHTGLQKTKALANGKPIRPWLQAFGWRVSTANYNESYILKQISGCVKGGAYGFLFWNASNSYDYVYKALHRLASVKKAKENQ